MSISYYMDVHIRYAVTRGLRLRGIDVLTAQEDNAVLLNDSELLDRASELQRVLFSQDDDLLAEGVLRQVSGDHFAGLVYAHQLNITIGQCIHDLAFIAEAAEPEELVSTVIYLPLS